MTTAARPQPRPSGTLSPRYLRPYVGALAVLATLATAVTALTAPGRDVPAPALWAIGLLWLLTVVADAWGVELPLPVGNEHVSFIEVVLVPVMVLLPPAHAIGVVLVAGLTLDLVVARKPAIKTVFNTSSRVLGVAVGTAAFHAIAGGPFEARASHLAAAVAAGALLVVITGVAFGVLRTILSGDGWRTTVRELAPSSLFDFGLAATGVLAAVLVVAAPVALPLLLVPTSVDVLRVRVRAQTYELRAGKERAEAANQAKTAFLSRVSHELRTPLNVILGYGQLLELEEDLPDGADEAIAAILRSGRHLLGLIDETLDISRIESGELHLELGAVDIEDVVAECVGLVRPLAAQRTVGLRIDPGPRGLLVAADRPRLVQVLLNLLTNAIAYDREGGAVSVTVTGGDDQVRIAVSDTGPGIAEEEMARLFVPFERLRSSEGTTGTGLGLSIVERLVTAMGGELAVSSVVGEGTTFTVTLPVAEGD